MKNYKIILQELKNFLLLWSTQALSTLGSSMTNFALIIWSYQAEGSALATALLSVCTYAPYVIVSLFAGALSDTWSKKRILLVSDTFAAIGSVIVLILIQTRNLEIWHLYVLNALNGLMNTFQQPASDVTISLLTPKKYYQKVGGMQSFSNSLTNILTPILASALLALTSIQVVIMVDLITFMIAFCTLSFGIEIPTIWQQKSEKENVFSSIKAGIQYLKDNRGIFDLILFLAAINLTASMFNASLPALLLPIKSGGEQMFGTIHLVSGIAMLIGSIMATLMPRPKSRVRVICNSLLVAMSTENFILAFAKSFPIWCIGAILGWICIPIMNANMNALFRKHIPLNMQGRVYSARNAFQFFTIPIGYALGGILIDTVFEPFMSHPSITLLTNLFGSEKGSGAAMLLSLLGVLGVLTCLLFRWDSNIWELEKKGI